MKVARLASAFLLTTIAASNVFAGLPGQFDFEFTAPGGDIPEGGSPTEGLSIFPLVADGSIEPGVLTVELLLNGLTHTAPWDLDIYLFDPLGNNMAIMTDRGDMNQVVLLDMIFSDAGSPLPANPDTQLATGPWQTEAGNLNGTFAGTGAGEWRLVIVDDSEGNLGSLESWTLRGTVVPEPVTLSLLAIGAVATLRRRK